MMASINLPASHYQPITAENETQLVCIKSSLDAKLAHLILQSGALQSQPFGCSAIACDPPRRGSQSLDDYTAFRLSKAGARNGGYTHFGKGAKLSNRHL